MIESHVPLMDVRVDGKADRWVPVLRIGDAGETVGLSEAGDWLVGDARGCFRLPSAAAGMALLPVLAGPPDVFLSRLRSAVLELGIHAPVVDDFPIALAMDTALAGRSVYWADLALAWVGAVPITPGLRELLRALSEASWAPPSSRQVAQRKLRELPGA